jgi:hypothetical protein
MAYVDLIFVLVSLTRQTRTNLNGDTNADRNGITSLKEDRDCQRWQSWDWPQYGEESSKMRDGSDLHVSQPFQGRGGGPQFPRDCRFFSGSKG